MTFGHVVLEGYCNNENDHAVQCKGKNIVSPKCFMENRIVCKYFGWCEARNLIVMTNEMGDEIKCKSYDLQDRKEWLDLL